MIVTSTGLQESDRRGDPPPGTLARAAASNVAWGYLSFVVAKLLVFGSTAVLARILSPAEFGVVGFALVVIGWLDLTRDLGVGAALIARPVVDQRIGSIALFTAVAWSAVLAGSLLLTAPALGTFFESTQMVPVAQVLSVGFFITGLGSVHDALLYRDLALNRRIIPDVSQAIVKGVISLGCAFSGFGYWSLVFGQIAGQLTFTAVAWRLHSFRPVWTFDIDIGRSLLRFGIAVVATKVLTAAFISLTFLTVARELGAASLGVFTVAYTIADILLMNTFVLVSMTLFPVFARLQGDLEGLRRGSLLVQRYLGLVAFPIGFGLAAITPLFVDVIYGERWQAAAIILQLLAIRGVISSIGWHAGEVGKALGRAGLQLRLTAGSTIVMAPFLPFVAANWGLPGVTGILVLAGIVAMVLSLVLLRVLVALSVPAVAAELLPGLKTGLAVVGVIVIVLAASGSMHPAARLLGALFAAGFTVVIVTPFVAPEIVAIVRPWLVRLQRMVPGAQAAP